MLLRQPVQRFRPDLRGRQCARHVVLHKLRSVVSSNPKAAMRPVTRVLQPASWLFGRSPCSKSLRRPGAVGTQQLQSREMQLGTIPVSRSSPPAVHHHSFRVRFASTTSAATVSARSTPPSRAARHRPAGSRDHQHGRRKHIHQERPADGSRRAVAQRAPPGLGPVVWQELIEQHILQCDRKLVF